jgi:hypothetical protein
LLRFDFAGFFDRLRRFLSQYQAGLGEKSNEERAKKTQNH